MELPENLATEPVLAPRAFSPAGPGFAETP